MAKHHKNSNIRPLCYVFLFFSPQLRGEFAVTRVPLAQKGNFNDIAHQPYIRAFRAFSDPKRPVKTMTGPWVGSPASPTEIFKSLGQPCQKKPTVAMRGGAPLTVGLSSKVTPTITYNEPYQARCT